MAPTTTPKMPGTPKPWMNKAMATMLRLPGIRRLLGKMFGVITVTGAKTGRRYSTPIQYMKLDGDYVVLSQKHRIWWRNIEGEPQVDLLVGGEMIRGQARIATGSYANDVLGSCLARNPRVAKFYGIQPDDEATIDPRDLDRLREQVAAIVITPDG